MISPINSSNGIYNGSNTHKCNSTPSFGGVVRVKRVFIDNAKTSDMDEIKRILEKLKAILMKQKDTPQSAESMGNFRSVYARFDRDYKAPAIKMTGDTRDVFSKIRKGNTYYLVSGPDAESVAVAGKNIGNKRSLEYNYGEAGAYLTAKNNYHDVKDEVSQKYLFSTHPNITVYAQRDKKGIARVIGAQMENDNVNPRNSVSSIIEPIFFNKPKEDPVPVKILTAKDVLSKPTPEPTKQVVSSVASEVSKEPEKPLFDHSKLKPLGAPKPKRRKKIIDDPNQLKLWDNM